VKRLAGGTIAAVAMAAVVIGVAGWQAASALQNAVDPEASIAPPAEEVPANATTPVNDAEAKPERRANPWSSCGVVSPRRWPNVSRCSACSTSATGCGAISC
jgi:hypothetical protein